MHDIQLIIFDMDGTLLQKRTIYTFAEEKHFTPQLNTILNTQKQPYEKTIEIAQLLKDTNVQELLKIFQTIPLQPHVKDVLTHINNQNIHTIIATDSYQFVADNLKKRLHIHNAYANNLITKNNIVTGEIHLHNKNLERCNNKTIYSICKEKILHTLCKQHHISPNQTLAIGDGLVDCAMLQQAGIGIAYKAPKTVQQAADISTDDFRTILNYL